MPKLVPPRELDAVLRAVAGFPEGVSIEDVKSTLGIELPRRTLQRRLAQLVEQKRLIVTGRGRGSRYTISPTGVEVHVPPGEITIKGYPPRVEIYIPISPEGEVIKQAVREPIQNRRPVGYNRAFLDAYRPNDTFYLAQEIPPARGSRSSRVAPRPYDLSIRARCRAPGRNLRATDIQPIADRPVLELQSSGGQYLFAA